MDPRNQKAGFLRGWRRSIAAKFILLAVSLTTATLGTTAWISYNKYQDNSLSQLQAKIELLASFVASISPDRIFSYDFSTLHGYVRELSEERDVIYALVVSEKNEPMTSYLHIQDPMVAEAKKAVGDGGLLKVVQWINQLPGVFVVDAPIKFNQREIGRVIIGATRQHVERELQRVVIWNVIGGALVILLLVVGIYLIFLNYVLRPTQQLMQGARRVAHGNLEENIPLSSEDELGKLAQSFNEMMGNLKRSNETRESALVELRDLNRTLEVRVEERTRAIESVNRELERLALFDALTGLPNRTLVQDRLKQTLNTALRSKKPFAVMLMDLDRFKEVNDTFGHHAGDQLLKKISDRLRSLLLPTDTIARLGGDEFAILLPNTDQEGAVVVAGKLMVCIEQPVELEGVSVSVAASLGIAVFPECGSDTSTLLKYADIAMYEAKQNKTGYCLYHREIDTHSPRRLALMSDLRGALEAKQLFLTYQPIVDILSGRVRGVEALARWNHPKQGLISPEKFVPMIEQTGLVRSFGYWLLDTALGQWAAWKEQGTLTRISINLSMHNVQDKEFTGHLAELLDKWQVRPHALIIELTESAMMSDPDFVLVTLERFRSLGVDIAIDDFGTGYSSLNYLKRFPVQEIKIDRSFVLDMSADKDDATIVRSIIDLAHNLGRKVVAEGVESAETLEMLRQWGCDLAQGYFLGHPLTSDELSLERTNDRAGASLAVDSTVLS